MRDSIIIDNNPPFKGKEIFFKGNAYMLVSIHEVFYSRKIYIKCQKLKTKTYINFPLNDIINLI